MQRGELNFRVFVSSTFDDMKAERDALQATVFPRLVAYCRARNARFQAIDLRWGVSEEAALDQQTMTICLRELARCQSLSPRPNFIVLLGERYGWRPLPAAVEVSEFEQLRQRVPEELMPLLDRWYERDDNAVPPEYFLRSRVVHPMSEARETEAAEWSRIEPVLHGLLEGAASLEFPDPADRRRRPYEESATHREIRLGALDATDAATHVHCYFRETPGQADDVRVAAVKANLTALFPDPDAHVYRYAAFSAEDERQSALAALAARVERDLRAIIDAEIVAFVAVSPFHREIEAHATFGRERRDQFVGRRDALDTIRDYLASDNRAPLVVHGAGGAGKTALVAEGAARARETASPATTVVTRFLGATPDSSELRPLLGSICDELAAGEAPGPTLPTEMPALIGHFRTRLMRATAERPIVLFLDALDQIGSLDAARELRWLPDTLPAHVKMIVSVLDADGPDGDCGRTIQQSLPEALRLPVTPLSVDEGGELLNRWLAEQKRTLQPAQRDAVLAPFAAHGSPLYLRLALGEARRWRSREAPEPLGPDVPAVMRRLLTRLEKERHHGEALTRSALRSLASARRGLTESELLGVLSTDQPVLADLRRRSPRSPETTTFPVVMWSRLSAELDLYLSTRQAGKTAVLTFYHRQLRDGVAERYLGQEADLRAAHAQLAAYFAGQARDDRIVDELPWQLARAAEWRRLVELLADLEFFEAAWTLNKDDVRAYWAGIERESAHTTVGTYLRRQPGDRRDYHPALWHVAALLSDTGHPREALATWEEIQENILQVTSPRI